MDSSKVNLPKTIFILGYGALSRCFVEILYQELPNINLIIADMVDLPPNEDKTKKFRYIKMKVDRKNLPSIFTYIEKGDILVDLSTDIDSLEMWKNSILNGVRYLGTSMEEWGDSENLNSHPKNEQEMFDTSIGSFHEEAEKDPLWNANKGISTVFEHGFNPGLISHFMKKGLTDAAKYFLNKDDWKDLDKDKIRKYLNEGNYPKLAQALKLHTIHTSEQDTQMVDPLPKDIKTKLYNTWSCRGFLTEILIPVQATRGSHEDLVSKEFPRIRNNTTFMSWKPATNYFGNYN